MKTKKNALLPKISFFLSFLFFIFLFTAHTQESKKTNEARQLWLKGFEIYEKAELDEKLGKYSEALQGYEKAITFFKTVRSNYPDWNTYLIDFRIKKCSEQITNLRNLLKKTEEKRTVIDEKVPSALDVKIYEARIKDLQEELLSTRQQLEKALSGISAAKKEAAQGAAALEELRRLNQEKIELEKRYQLLSEQLDKALKKEESSKSLDKDTELNALKNKLKEYVDKLNAIEGKIKEYEEQTQILKKENQTLKMAKTEFDFKEKEYENKIKTTEKRLEDTLKNLDLLREKITKQEEIVEELKKENGKLNSKLAEQKKENDELTDKLSKALDKSQSDSLLKKLQEENTNLLKNIEDNKLKIDNFAKIAEEQHKIAAELAVKNEKLEKILADYVKKDETSTTELIALKKKLSELSELSASQEKDIATLTKEKLAYEDTIQKLSQKVNQLTKKDDDYTELTKYAAEMDTKNRELIKELNDIKESSKQSAQEIEQLKKDLITANEISQKNTNALQIEKNKNQELLVQIDELKKEVDKFKDVIELSKAELKKYSEQNELLKKEKEELEKIPEENKELQKKYRETVELLEKYKKDKENDETIKKDLMSESEKLTEKLKKLIAEKEESQKELKKLKKDLSKLQEENSELNKKIEKMTSIVENIKKNAPDSAKIAELENQNKEKEKNIDTMKTEIAKLKELNSNLMSRLEEKVAESLYPKHLAEEKEKLLQEIEKKEKIIQELKKELKSSKTVKEESSEKKSNPPLKELSDKVVILITEAKNAEKNSNYDVAIWHYQKIFEYDKENQSALVGLAGIFYAKNEKDKAMSYIKLLNPEKIYDPYDALKAAKISLAIFPQDKNNALLFYKKAIELGAEKDKEFENLLK